MGLLTLLAGDLGRQWFDKFNSNAAALDARDTARLATEASLQAQINAVAGLVYVPAAGNYAAPPAGGVQPYSANGGSKPWTSATPNANSRVAVSTGGTTPYIWFHGDVWDGPNGVFFGLSSYSQSSGLTLHRIVVANGVPTIQASLAILTGGSAYYTVVSAVAVSATVVRFQIYNSGGSPTGPQDYLVSYANGSLSSSVVTPTNGLLGLSNNKRGILLGSASWLAFGLVPSGAASMVGAVQKDRAGSTASFVALADGTASGAQMSQDNLGGGFFVMGVASSIPADPTARPGLGLYYATDFKTIKLDEIRIPAPATFAAWVSVIALSSTLVLAQYKDAGGNFAFAAISVSTTTEADARVTGALGLFATYNAGALGTICAYPLTYGALVAYVFRQVATASAQGACRLNRLTFTPGAASGTELTSAAANDIAFTLGTTGTALSTTTVKNVGAVIQYQDTLLILFGDNNNTLQAEVFSLA